MAEPLAPTDFIASVLRSLANFEYSTTAGIASKQSVGNSALMHAFVKFRRPEASHHGGPIEGVNKGKDMRWRSGSASLSGGIAGRAISALLLAAILGFVFWLRPNLDPAIRITIT
jgi:hypothetical protein